MFQYLRNEHGEWKNFQPDGEHNGWIVIQEPDGDSDGEQQVWTWETTAHWGQDDTGLPHERTLGFGGSLTRAEAQARAEAVLLSAIAAERHNEAQDLRLQEVQAHDARETQ